MDSLYINTLKYLPTVKNYINMVQTNNTCQYIVYTADINNPCCHTKSKILIYKQNNI